MTAPQKTHRVLLLPQVDLHYLPAHFEDQLGEDVSPRYLNAGEEKKRGTVWEKEARPTGCFGSVRPGGAQPEHRTRLSGLNGLGGLGWGDREWKERKIRRMTSIQYKCSIHCCFCIQPLDSVKCFNICAILNYFKNNCLHWPKVYSFIETIAYKCLFLFCFLFFVFLLMYMLRLF